MALEKQNKNKFILSGMLIILLGAGIFFAQGVGSNRPIESDGLGSQMPDPCNDPRVRQAVEDRARLGDPKERVTEKAQRNVDPNDWYEYPSHKLSRSDHNYLRQIVRDYDLSSEWVKIPNDYAGGYTMITLISRFYNGNCHE